MFVEIDSKSRNSACQEKIFFGGKSCCYYVNEFVFLANAGEQMFVD
jgi:hypothetical protein